MRFWNHFTASIHLNDRQLSKRTEWTETAAYGLFAFAIPFFAGEPQWLIGALVNMMLIMAALNLDHTKWIPLAVLPSLGVLARGLVWGPFTAYLVFLLPFIWLANGLLIWSIKYFSFYMRKKRYLAILYAAILKTTLLTAAAAVLFTFELVPSAVLVFMSILQLITALAGGLMALGAQNLLRRYSH